MRKLALSNFCTQLSQLLACELGAIIKHQLFRYSKAAYYILLDEVLNLVGRDLRYWLGLYPLHEILYDDHVVLHLPYH